MSDNVSIMLDGIAEYIDRSTPRWLAIAAQRSILAIQMRIQRGVGLDNKPFKPYSTKPIYVSDGPLGKQGFYPGGYAQFKEIHAGPDAWLRKSGQMMNAITQKNINDICEQIYFSTTEDERKASANDYTRPFWGLTEDEFSTIMNELMLIIESDICAMITPVEQSYNLEM